MIPLTDVSLQVLSTNPALDRALDSDLDPEQASWQKIVNESIRDISALLHALGLPDQSHYSNFPILVPGPYLSRIERGNPNDPLLRQVISTVQEVQDVPGYIEQPLNESTFAKTSGLIQKYHGRVLLIVTGSCAINCRYCFRRHFPYQDFQPTSKDWQRIIDALMKDTSINEVILSGGDPLMMSDKRLKWIVQQVETIPHIDTIRIHSRLPVVIPQRITKTLIEILAESRLKAVLVTHINHPQELDETVSNAMLALQRADVLLLNQSVLLKDINNDAEILSTLSKQLFKANILPYYLHALDPVAGAAHFDVSGKEAEAIMSVMRASLPGYLVPKLVREVPGQPSKSPL
jgi:EF-P beta-lysylation protein EpmB